MSARPRVPSAGVRHLVVVLGDQLDANSAALDGFDPARDAVWMAEVAGESEHVVSSQPRTAVFLAAMRHFRDAQRKLGRRVEYVELDAPGNTQTLAGELARSIRALKPERILMVGAGEWRLAQEIAAVAEKAGLTLEVRAFAAAAHAPHVLVRIGPVAVYGKLAGDAVCPLGFLRLADGLFAKLIFLLEHGVGIQRLLNFLTKVQRR